MPDTVQPTPSARLTDPVLARRTLNGRPGRAQALPVASIGLRDVARLAAVDISTASRALNHDPRVNPQRAEHIRHLAEKIGYRPRPLRSKLAQSVGILVCTEREGQMIDRFMERIAWLAQRDLADRRLHVNVECLPRTLPVRLPAVVKQNRVDGVLLGGHPPAELVAEIRQLGLPAVAINDSVARLGISCVRSNPEPAIRQTVLHLAARGHERFAMLNSSLSYPTNQARRKSFDTALAELDLRPRPEWLVADLPADLAGGRLGIQRLMAFDLPLPTAILCENDWIALGAMQELERRGLSVPRDVSLVGHDDLWICDQLEPTLTSIHRAEEELVSAAIDLLTQQIEGGPTEPPRELLVEGSIVWRQSIGPAPARLRAAATIEAAV